MKRITGIVALFLLTLAVSGCTAEKTTMEEVKDDTTVEQTAEETKENSSTAEEAQFADTKDWREAYIDFLKDFDSGNDLEYYMEDGALCSDPSFLQYLRSDGRDVAANFLLYDLDGDQIPELFLEYLDSYSQSVLTYNEGRMIALNVTAGYETSGEAKVYDLKNTPYFIVKHAPPMMHETSVFSLKAGRTQELLGCKLAFDGKANYMDGDGENITKEDFCNSYHEYTGLEWTADYTFKNVEFPDDYIEESFAAIMEQSHAHEVTAGEYMDVKDAETIIVGWGE